MHGIIPLVLLIISFFLQAIRMQEKQQLIKVEKLSWKQIKGEPRFKKQIKRIKNLGLIALFFIFLFALYVFVFYTKLI